jgi:hypothetical protein
VPLATELVAAVGKEPITGIVLDASYYPSNLRIPGIEDADEAYNALIAAVSRFATLVERRRSVAEMKQKPRRRCWYARGVLQEAIMADDKPKPETKSGLGRRGMLVALLGAMTSGWPVSGFGQGYYGPPYGGPSPMPRKIPKAVAEYQYYPNDGMSCEFCRHYRGGYCRIVEGPIAPYGWCRYFWPVQY